MMRREWLRLTNHPAALMVLADLAESLEPRTAGEITRAAREEMLAHGGGQAYWSGPLRAYVEHGIPAGIRRHEEGAER